MNTAERLNIIRQRAERKEQAENIRAAEEKRKRTELMDKIRALAPKVRDVIRLANACKENNVDIPQKQIFSCDYNSGDKYGYPHEFIAEGIRHHTGFIVMPRRLVDAGMIDYVGIENGGACGKYDFWTDGENIFSVNEDDRTERKEPRIKDMVQFLDEFPVFERAFLKWVDSLQYEM